jgi:hypothetical protein
MKKIISIVLVVMAVIIALLILLWAIIWMIYMPTWGVLAALIILVLVVSAGFFFRQLIKPRNKYAQDNDKDQDKMREAGFKRGWW